MDILDAQQIVETHFAGIIGQERAKERLTDILLSPIVENGYMPPVLILGSAGLGKSRLLRAIKGIIKEVTARKIISFERGTEMGSVSAFFNDTLIPYFHDKDCVMVVDEFHEAQKPIQSVIRSMIEITNEREPKVVRYGDLEVVSNPCRQSFIFFTNKESCIDPALMSRFERIDLTNYSDDEMEQILEQSVAKNGITFEEGALSAIASCNRGTARDIVSWGGAIRFHVAMNKNTSISMECAAKILRKRETFPMGVTKAEIGILLVLEEYGEQQMKQIAAKLQRSPAEQNANESYLIRRNFIGINGTRHITGAGRKYLQKLREGGLIAKND
jgi:Holliday junction resolvasome RuvABC ATP-dependent DNA helicase subunit